MEESSSAAEGTLHSQSTESFKYAYVTRFYPLLLSVFSAFHLLFLGAAPRVIHWQPLQVYHCVDQLMLNVHVIHRVAGKHGMVEMSNRRLERGVDGRWETLLVDRGKTLARERRAREDISNGNGDLLPHQTHKRRHFPVESMEQWGIAYCGKQTWTSALHRKTYHNGKETN